MSPAAAIAVRGERGTGAGRAVVAIGVPVMVGVPDRKSALTCTTWFLMTVTVLAYGGYPASYTETVWLPDGTLFTLNA